MLKHPLWLVVLGLLVAGGAFVYVQSQRSRLLPEFPSEPTPNLAFGSAAQRLSTWETLPPPAADATAPAVAARAYPQATALTPTVPDIFFPRLTPNAGPAVPSMFSANRPDPAAPLFPPTGELWTGSGFLEFNRPGGDQIPDLSNKRPHEDQPLTLGGDNASGIGPQCLLIKDEDTTFLGRVAGRYSDAAQVSEVFLGCQFEHRLSLRNKVFSTVEYACDPTDLGSHTLRTQAAWEVLLDPEETLSLRTAVMESSTYAASREQAKNLDYSLSLTWKF
jgi:hypothetical protein